MKLKITNTARRFGYITWSKKETEQIEKILAGAETVFVILNGLNLSEKRVDRRFNRISLGYKFTRALPANHKTYSLTAAVGQERTIDIKTL